MKKLLSALRYKCIYTALLSVALLSLPLAAQDANGRIIGVVTDPSGSVIPHAKVVVTNTQTNVSNETTTGPDGSYQVLLLPIGTYRIAAEAQGFRKSVTNPQTLEINQSLKMDLKLEVGSTAETVQVEATASGVETTNATVASTITANEIVNAPLNGRDVMSLALTMPGVTPTTTGVPGSLATGSSTAAGTFSINGARPDSITYLMDGGVNNDLLSNGLVLDPNPDTIEEFKILTNNYNAEYGRNAGGIVSVVSRSGTNTFHGSAYDYIRNGDLNANTFFNNESHLPVDPLKRNQFGVTVGGPIWIPKIVNAKNRVFFFMGYQGQRQTDLTSTAKTVVFTPAELGGDFSHGNASGTGPDPLVVSFLQQYPFFQSNPTLASQGIIDPSRINASSSAYIKAGLIPSAANGNLGTVFQGAATSNADELTEKIDFNITQNDRLTVTLGSSRNPQINPFSGGQVAALPDISGGNHYSGTVAYIKTFSPTIINEFRFNAQRNNIQQSIPGSKEPTAGQLGITATDDDPVGPPIISLTGGFTSGFSPQGPTHEIDNTYNWSDVLTWTKGHHGFKMGFNYTPFQNNTVYDFYVTGEYFYYGTGGGSYSQNSFADFLMGLPDEYFQAPKAPSNIRTHNVGTFFQDEWKVAKNVTMTLGLRWEYNSPKFDTQGREFSIIPGDQSTRFPNAPPGLVFPGDAGVPKGTNFPDYKDFAPRFGVAWNPFGGKTTIRTGFGMFYDILKGEDSLQFNGQEPFFSESDLYFNPLSGNPTSAPINFTNPFAAAGQVNPFPSKPPASDINWAAQGFLPVAGGGVYVVDPHLKTPYIYQYNFSVQREVARNTTLEVDYLGSDSHKLTGLVDLNPIVLGTKTRVLNTLPGTAAFCAGQPAPCPYSYVDDFKNKGSANYSALAVGLTRRTSDLRYIGNLQYQVSYTRAKSLDNESGFRSSQSQVPTYNWNQFYGPSSYNVPNTFATSAVWSLPFDKAWSSGPKRLTQGWELDPVVNYRSGLPLNVKSGISLTSTSVGPSGYGDPNIVQANLVASSVQEYSPKVDQSVVAGKSAGNYYFNPSDFSNAALKTVNTVTNPGSGTYGTLGKNAFQGPDLINVNLTLRKTIAIYERARISVGADFFNLLNHTQFTTISTTITSSQFGQATATNPARIIQLSARFTF